jgi:hypothetical protein
MAAPFGITTRKVNLAQRKINALKKNNLASANFALIRF